MLLYSLNKRGYGRHARALFTNLLKLDSNNRYVFFIDFKEDLEELPSNASWQYVPASKPASEAARADGSRSIKDLLTMSNALSRPGFEYFNFPDCVFICAGSIVGQEDSLYSRCDLRDISRNDLAGLRFQVVVEN